MYPVGDAQTHGMLSEMYLVGGWGRRRRYLCHVPSGGGSVTHVPSGGWGGEEYLCHVPSGGCSVTHVPSGGWGRRGGSLPCTQWGMLS